MTRRVVAIVTDALLGPEEVDQVRGDADSEGVDLRLIAPAVEAGPFRHTLGDIDEPRAEAEQRLQRSLAALRASGIEVRGEVGDPDPIQATRDALLEEPADEVLIFERAEGEARWFENGLFEEAREEIEPPLRLVVVAGAADEDGSEHHVVEVEKAPAGTKRPQGDDVDNAYIQGLNRADFVGMAVGIVGTIAVILLAAIAASGAGTESGWNAVAIGVAIATALINTAHVVGILLFEAVRYRQGFARLFRTLSAVGTPLAIIVNAAIAVFA